MRKILIPLILICLPIVLQAQVISLDSSFNRPPEIVTNSEFSTVPFTWNVSISPSIFFHLRDKDEENPNIPDQYESLEERPSVGSLYSDNVGFKIGSHISIFLKTLETKLLLGVNYQFHSLKSEFQSLDVILGERLYLHSLSPYVGFEQWLDYEKLSVFGMFGPSVRFYKGKGSFNSFDVRNNYNPSPSFAGSIGIKNSNISNTPLYLQLELTFEMGVVTRKNVEFFKDGYKVGSATIEGDKSFRDDFVSVSFTFGYQLFKKTK